MIEEVSIAPTNRPLSDPAVQLIQAARRRSKAINCFGFVPCDYELAWNVLDRVERGRFCEWGSGMGVVAGLAEILGFDARGIECDAELADMSRALLAEFGLSSPIETGDYFSSRDQADVYFVYCWPGKVLETEAHFSSIARPGARLLICYGQNDIRCKMKARDIKARDSPSATQLTPGSRLRMRPKETFSPVLGLLNSGQFSKAESTCCQILKGDPENAAVWHLRGIAQARSSKLKDAAESFERAVRIDPHTAKYHYNLGLAYKHLNEVERAVESYRNAIQCQDDFLEARNNLGTALAELGRSREAVDCLRAVVAQAPNSSDAHYNLANLLMDTGHDTEAIRYYRLALELNTEFTAARENLGRALCDCDRLEEAKQVWLDWLSREPDNAIAKHMLGALGELQVPSRCDDQYVRDTFDRDFARTFDSQLAHLRYRAPDLIMQAIQVECESPTQLNILDAGCGTGLCGPLLRPMARQLVGVDLSDDMLDEARKRAVYDELSEGELTEYLHSHGQAFDLIVASDTLCYFGDLDEVLRSAHESLVDGGLLVFSLELAAAKDADRPYHVQHNGRYCHNESYVRDTLRGAGHVVLNIQLATLRNERGKPVEGLIVTARTTKTGRS